MQLSNPVWPCLSKRDPAAPIQDRPAHGTDGQILKDFYLGKTSKYSSSSGAANVRPIDVRKIGSAMHAQPANLPIPAVIRPASCAGNLNTSAKLIYASSNSKRAAFLRRTAQKIAA